MSGPIRLAGLFRPLARSAIAEPHSPTALFVVDCGTRLAASGDPAAFVRVNRLESRPSVPQVAQVVGDPAQRVLGTS